MPPRRQSAGARRSRRINRVSRRPPWPPVSITNALPAMGAPACRRLSTSAHCLGANRASTPAPRYASRSAPVLGRSNMKTTANEGLYRSSIAWSFPVLVWATCSRPEFFRVFRGLNSAFPFFESVPIRWQVVKTLANKEFLEAMDGHCQWNCQLGGGFFKIRHHTVRIKRITKNTKKQRPAISPVDWRAGCQPGDLAAKSPFNRVELFQRGEPACRH